MSLYNIIYNILALAIPLLFAITLHEAAHGWVASKLGDKTALMLGRVTLNPLKHIDLFGTIIMPILLLVLSQFRFIFGWAKPVPVNWNNLNHPRRDMAIVALAGPAANLVMALIWAAIAKILILSFHDSSNQTVINLVRFFMVASNYGLFLNIVLMVLNLIPIPPLDGSRVISSILPPRFARKYELIEPYGIWILLALIVFGILWKFLMPIVTAVRQFIMHIFGLSFFP